MPLSEPTTSTSDRIRSFGTRSVENARRMTGWILCTIVLIAIIWYIHPVQVQVVVYKLLLVTLATVTSYLIDRTLYLHLQGIPTSAPGDSLSAARLLARALVFLGTVLGLTLGI
jgi:hypothetical protein